MVKEIIRFENTIFDPFHGNFRFSMVLNSSTRHPFQSDQSVVKDALLASYRRLKMPFCPLLVPNGTPIGLRLYANWGTIGTQVAPNWPRYTTKWIKRCGLYYFIKLLIQSSICNHIVDSFTLKLEISRLYIIAYSNSN